MNFKKKLSQLLSSINTGFINHVIEIKHPYNKNLEKVLNLLIKEGKIHGYKIMGTPKTFIVQLKIEKKQITKKSLVSKSKTSFPRFVSEYKLNSSAYKNPQIVQITSTNEGLISNNFLTIKGGEFLFEVL